MSDIADKAALRLSARATRAAFVAALDPMAHRLAFRALPTPVRKHLNGRKCVALYVGRNDEAPAQRLAEVLISDSKKLCLPCVVDRLGTMEFRQWAPGDALDEGRFGTRHPSESAQLCEPDAIIAPLLAFDDMLMRLGQGGGYYDRAFARYDTALRIGLAWSSQQIERVPADPWDVPLDMIITERSLMEMNEA